MESVFRILLKTTTTKVTKEFDLILYKDARQSDNLARTPIDLLITLDQFYLK